MKEYYPIYLVLFILGLIVLFRLNRKLFIVALLGFTAFSVILGKATLATDNIDSFSLYVTAHQYFLPFFMFYSIISGFGLYGISKLLNDRTRVGFAVVFILVLPFMLLGERYYDSDYSSNSIAFDRILDVIYPAPIKSVLITSGDNDAFQGWYMKNVERFRDDICLLSNSNMKKISWRHKEGCHDYFYSDYFSFLQDGDELNIAKLEPYMVNDRVMSAEVAEVNNVMKDHVQSVDDILYQNLYPRNIPDELLNLFEERRKSRREYFENFLHWDSCLNYRTDDYFSKIICRNYPLFMFNKIKDKDITEGEKSEMILTYREYSKHFEFRMNDYSREYLKKSAMIVDRNNLTEFYLK